MKCLICKGEIVDSFTTHIDYFGDCMIRIKDVPCFKCEQCGEISYSGSVVKTIERILALDHDFTKSTEIN